MVSIPTLAGALMRFPLGLLSQHIGRKNAAILEMSLIIVAMLYGYLIVERFNDVLAMGVLLGTAGASFGVALSLGAGWFPREHKGFAMGIAGAGNVGTVVALLVAPPVAQAYGWHAVYGWTAVAMLIPLTTILFMACFAALGAGNGALFQRKWTRTWVGRWGHAHARADHSLLSGEGFAAD